MGGTEEMCSFRSQGVRVQLRKPEGSEFNVVLNEEYSSVSRTGGRTARFGRQGRWEFSLEGKEEDNSVSEAGIMKYQIKDIYEQ